MEQSTFQNKSKVELEKVYIEYQGRRVQARRLIVSTLIPINIDQAWAHVQTPELLQFVAKGMIKFKSVDSGFPKKWERGKIYGAKMLIFGFIPFGGIHYLEILTIDPTNFIISTKEWDNSAKVWNHEVKMKAIGTDAIHYKNSSVTYGGFLTGFITAFAKLFYKYRQKRWQIVAKANLEFGK